MLAHNPRDTGVQTNRHFSCPSQVSMTSCTKCSAFCPIFVFYLPNLLKHLFMYTILFGSWRHPHCTIGNWYKRTDSWFMKTKMLQEIRSNLRKDNWATLRLKQLFIFHHLHYFCSEPLHCHLHLTIYYVNKCVMDYIYVLYLRVDYKNLVES